MNSRRSGLLLVVAGLLGGAFFWWTDPRLGMVRPAGLNPIDAMSQAQIGTAVGIIGSALVLLIGTWLLTRRMV